jgi:hypothetical protein
MPYLAKPHQLKAKRGRPLSVDINPHYNMALDNPGVWIAEDYTEAHATSAVRQFKKLGEMEIMTAKAEQPGHRTVLVRTNNPERISK